MDKEKWIFAGLILLFPIVLGVLSFILIHGVLSYILWENVFSWSVFRGFTGVGFGVGILFATVVAFDPP